MMLSQLNFTQNSDINYTTFIRNDKWEKYHQHDDTFKVSFQFYIQNFSFYIKPYFLQKFYILFRKGI
jgi:hypothetical protein